MTSAPTGQTRYPWQTGAKVSNITLNACLRPWLNQRHLGIRLVASMIAATSAVSHNVLYRRKEADLWDVLEQPLCIPKTRIHTAW
jgi:hypothetical protein